MSEARFELLRAVEMLSRPADDQLYYLRNLSQRSGIYWLGVDELALEFDDAFRPAQHSLTGSEKATLLKLDKLLDAMSGESNAPLWTEDALCNREEWAEVRRLASNCLDALTNSARDNGVLE